MTTLEAIGFTLAGGSCVFFTSLCLFGCAVKKRSIYIAPRCTARPRDVIYNPHPTHSSQDRGSAMLGWIGWSLELTYPTMLEGVPGTGTRKDGSAGSLLKVNLDGIVCLRFHAVCLRISLLATILYLSVILPINLTARCFSIGDEEDLAQQCSTDAYNLTNFEKTTLANIPEVSNQESIWGQTYGKLVARLYGIVLCSWLVMFYTCYTLRREWIEILAMRRVYYLEYDMWGNRRKELAETLLNDEEDDEEFRKLKPSAQRVKKKLDPLKGRDPWIPHPEQRDTVPNIALYSLLVGALPSLPEMVVDESDVEMAVGFSKRQSIDWQLDVTKTFFDQCVPNQPGYSSSVAAVTILPDAPDIANAWTKWYDYASALRRLRLIKQLIADLRYYDIEDDSSCEAPPDQIPVENRSVAQQELLRIETFTVEQQEISPSVYRDPMRNQEYYRNAMSSYYDDEFEDLLNLHFGPEQTAVYSRELAMSAASCCPNGCFEGRLRRSRIDELLLQEQDARLKVRETYEALQQAQHKAASMPEASEVQHVDGGDDVQRLNAIFDQKPPDLGVLPDDLEVEKEVLKKFSKEPVPGLMIEAGIADTQDQSRQTISQPDNTAESHSSRPMGNEGAFPFLDLSGTGPRKRQQSNLMNSASSRNSSSAWAQVEHIVHDGDWRGHRRVNRGHADQGGWQVFSIRDAMRWIRKKWTKVGIWATTKTTDVVDDLARDTTYAVVTFTSRQGAVAARNCLTDGRGQKRWIPERNIPVPPLADAAACDLKTCRGCLRPVTLSLPDKQKQLRFYFSVILIIAIYVFYTVPLTFASSLANPERLGELFPRFADLGEKNEELYELLSGIVPALIWTLFFSLCPLLFKTIANFGSSATSVNIAERRALQMFWWFMVVTAFSGNLLATTVINIFNSGFRISGEFEKLLAQIAAIIPTQISASWINWIIVRFTITLPLNYMLQINTFLFACLHWNCCRRLVTGGGPGGPLPYRIYVDTGVVFLCLMALAPASPLVAPVALFYCLYCVPLFRRNLVFMYRPKFDAGGIRWIFLFEVFISSMVVGQVLLTAMMALKKALGPAVVAAVPIIPTFIYRHNVRKQFLRAFQDAALLQTSTLDNWDPTQPTSMEKREEFRRFLVDAHKAAYVPVCIAGRAKGTPEDVTVTAEPAVVVPHVNDIDDADQELGSEVTNDELSEFHQLVPQQIQTRGSQYGASLMRIGVSPTAFSASQHLRFNDDGSVTPMISLTSSQLGSVSVRENSVPLDSLHEEDE